MPDVLSITCDAKQLDAELKAIDAKVKELKNNATQEAQKAAQAVEKASKEAAAQVKQDVRSVQSSAAEAASSGTAKIADGLKAIRAELNNTAGGAKKLISSFLAGGGAIGIIIAGVMSLGKIVSHVFGAQTRALQQASETAQANAQSIRETAEAHEQARQKSDGYLNRLGALASAEKLSNTEKTEALHLIDELSRGYADLGISIDETTGKLTGVDKAMTQKLQRDKDNRIQELESELRQLDADDKIQEQLRDSAGWSGWWLAGLPQLLHWDSTTRIGGEEQATKAGEALTANAARRRELTKRLADARNSDEASRFRERETAKNEALAAGLQERRDAFTLRQSDEEFSRLTDPAARIANRQQLIDRAQEERLTPLLMQISATQAAVDESSGDDRITATRSLLQLQKELQTEEEKVHGWEQQIADIKREQTKAYADIRRQSGYELAAGKLAASEEWEKLEALKLEEELRQKNLKLTQDQKDVILAQRAALRTQALDAGLRDQAVGLMEQAAERTGRGREFAIEKALREARKTNGGDLDSEREKLVRKLAELSYGMSHVGAGPQLGDLSIRTNSLTARGGFAGGAGKPAADDINVRIANYNKQQVDSLKELERICGKIGNIN